MIASILLQLVGKDSNKVLATTGNLNNDIGVPQIVAATIYTANKYAVIEMGMNHSW